MISNDLPQGMLQNTIPLMFGHPDPDTLLTPELRNAMLHVINSPHAYTTLQYGAGQGPQGLINFLQNRAEWCWLKRQLTWTPFKFFGITRLSCARSLWTKMASSRVN